MYCTWKVQTCATSTPRRLMSLVQARAGNWAEVEGESRDSSRGRVTELGLLSQAEQLLRVDSPLEDRGEDLSDDGLLLVVPDPGGHHQCSYNVL